MSEERNNFRRISLDEYRNRHDDIDARITMSELESGLLVETYSTSRVLERKDIAMNFTARLEVTDDITRASIGHVSLKLLVYSGEILQPLHAYNWDAIAYPEMPYEPSPPASWAFSGGNPIHFRDIGILRYGFFSRLTEDDASGLDAYHAARTREIS